MKLRPKIDKHDYETKKGHIVRFLTAGDKVKITIMFRGREQSRPELGRRLLDKLAEELKDLAVIESAAKQDGRNMIMVVAPIRPKGEIVKSGGGRKGGRGGDAEQAEAAPEEAPAEAPSEAAEEAPTETSEA
jgi:translation initiation factor IF-3